MTAAVLRISAGLHLPLEAGTATFGVLGQKGSGKSTAAVVMAEEMWKAGIPWVAVDPKGDWWGIRSSVDGKRAGLGLPVFGGLHGDVPLEAGSGAYIADLIFDMNLTAVLDVSDFTKAERARFLVAFFERIYRRHRAEPNVRHLFLEEAHEYIPQQVGREEGRLKEAAARIVLQGRTGGLGATICSQRSARIHKDVLTQVGTLIAMRTLAALDRKAIEGWVREHDVAAEMLASLPSLENGEGWLWSPEFLRKMVRVRFRPRSTFDSGATPTLGKSARPPATLADVDLAAIKTAMAETIERAEADDPKRLRGRIAELEAQVAAGSDGSTVKELRARVGELEGKLADALAAQVREVPVLSQEDVGRLREAVAPITAALDRMFPTTPPVASPPRVAAARRQEPRRAPDPPSSAGDAPALSKAERAILAVLAQHGARHAKQVALLTRYSHKSGGFRNALSKLRTAGYITRDTDMTITAAGLAALGDYEPLPTGQALIDWWKGELGKAEREILTVLLARWPAAVSVEWIAVDTGYSVSSGGFRNALSRLRSLELATGRGELRVNDLLGQASRDAYKQWCGELDQHTESVG